jgi:hypothetical protein
MPAATRSAANSNPKSGTLYSVHPSLAYAQAVVAGMKAKTGRSIDEWVSFVKKHGPKTESEQRDWLRKEHKLGMNYAGWIAGQVHGKGDEDTDPDKYLTAAERYVKEMFAGKRSGLRRIYDALLKLGLALGDDVKACPCQTMVPLFRKHVFCQIKPATNTRIDLGFCLRGVKPTKRLLDTGGEAKGDRITHRIAITSPNEIDDEVRRWMKKAYDAAEPAE